MPTITPPRKRRSKSKGQLLSSGTLLSGASKRSGLSSEEFSFVPPTEVSLKAAHQNEKDPGLQTDVLVSLWTESMLRKQGRLQTTPNKAMVCFILHVS